jgi:Pyridoxal-dependent decarboxylase conserved domain
MALINWGLIMPLRDRDAVRHRLEDCVFADRDLTRPVPKYRFPREGTLPRDAFQVVSDELMLDGNARQNLATFCQTWAEPELLALMAMAISQRHTLADSLTSFAGHADASASSPPTYIDSCAFLASTGGEQLFGGPTPRSTGLEIDISQLTGSPVYNAE